MLGQAQKQAASGLPGWMAQAAAQAAASAPSAGGGAAGAGGGAAGAGADAPATAAPSAPPVLNVNVRMDHSSLQSLWAANQAVSVRGPAALDADAEDIAEAKRERTDRARGRGGANRSGLAPAVLGGGPLFADRARLPIYAYRENLLSLISTNQVLVVQGDTGCGKTTQLPQFLLEEAAARGAPISIVCTQPRRISAMGVAERVANERGEPLGATVGYSIRLENKTSSATRLLFCTTGILMRRLEEDPTLQGTTHVVVDEVHERSVESDFLLMVLRPASADRAGPLLTIPGGAHFSSGAARHAARQAARPARSPDECHLG